MNCEAEIRMKGMQALIDALGLVDAERFMAAALRDRFNYTEWRRLGLPSLSVRELADEANRVSSDMATSWAHPGPPV